MVHITFIQPDGSSKSAQAVAGRSLMEAAVRHNVAGIEAECGGACSCGTCHVHVDPAWLERLGVAGGDEAATLDYASNLQPNSRLACQIVVGEALDGLVVRVAAAA
jgi:2Fe-2S ferredoxin